MPRLRPYQSEVSSQQGVPGEQADIGAFGGPAVQRFGQAVEDVGQNVGQIQRFMLEKKSREEVTDAGVETASLGAQLTEEFDAQAKNWHPGDPSLSETFPARVKARLDQLHGTEEGTNRYETQAGESHFQRRAAAISAHFVDLARTGDAHLSGEAAKEQHRVLVDTTGQFLYTHPAYFNIKREEVNSIIMDETGIYGRIPYVKREELARTADEKLALDAAQGFIRKSPNLALEVLKDPGLAQDEQYSWIAQYIPLEKRDALVSRAETEVRAQETAARLAEAELERQRKAAALTAETGLFEKLAAHDADPKNNPMLMPRDVLDSGLFQYDPVKGGAMLSMLHARSRERGEGFHTNPAVERQLFNDIYTDDPKRKIIDTGPLYQAYEDGQLSFTDMKSLRDELVKSRSPEGEIFGKEKADFFHYHEQIITRPGPFGIYADPSKGEDFYRFKKDVDAKVRQFVKDGKDPRVLFDPDSKEYLGKPGFIGKYTREEFGASPTTAPLPEPVQPPVFPPRTAPQALPPPASAPVPKAKKRSLEEIFGLQPKPKS